MKIKAIAILTALLTFAILPVWAKDGWKTLDSAEYGFSVDYPDGWEIQVPDDALFTLTNMNEGLPLVIAVVAQHDTLTESEGMIPVDLEAEMADMEKEISGLGLGESVVISRGYCEVKDFEAYKLDMELSLSGMAVLSMRNIIVDVGPSWVLLSFSWVDDAYDKHGETFEQMLDSIRVYSAN